MIDEPTPARDKNPAEAIYAEAHGAHETSKSLLPLLSLLEPPEGNGGLDEIRKLLTTIVQILGQNTRLLRELKAGAELAKTGWSPMEEPFDS